MSEIKECPFCGGPGVVLDHCYSGPNASGMETPEPYAACMAGCVQMKPVHCDEWPSGRERGSLTYKQARAEAVAVWNKRAIDGAKERERRG